MSVKKSRKFPGDPSTLGGGGGGHRCFLTLATLIISYETTFTCSLFLGRIHFRFSNHLEGSRSNGPR